jgi:hypothetical protein
VCVCVWTKAVFGTMTRSQKCNIRRNDDFHSKVENLWKNCKYENLKKNSFQITVIISQFKNNAFINHSILDFLN